MPLSQTDRSTATGTLRVRTRLDVPGWFYTSTADQVYYYFLAILNTTTELGPLYSEYLDHIHMPKPTLGLETKLLRSSRSTETS